MDKLEKKQDDSIDLSSSSEYELEKKDYITPFIETSINDTNQSSKSRGFLFNASKEKQSPKKSKEPKSQKDTGMISLTSVNIFNKKENLISLFPSTKQICKISLQLKQPIIIKSKEPKLIKFSKYGSFGVIKCEEITTYFLGQVSCSQFTIPENIENTKLNNIKFLYRGNQNKSNGLKLVINNEKFKLENNFQIRAIENTKMKNFIDDLNEFLVSGNFIDSSRMYSCNIKTIITFLIVLIIIFGVLIWLLINIIKNELKKNSNFGFFLLSKKINYNINDYIIGSENNNKTDYVLTIIKIILDCILLLSIILILIYIFKIYKNYGFSYLEETISERIRNVKDLEKFIERWNDGFFFEQKVRIWIPASMDYVMFNMDSEQDIQIEPHSLEESRKQIHK